ncbi:hypothetical protein GCM10027594_01450 [Hymenobacter agri]
MRNNGGGGPVGVTIDYIKILQGPSLADLTMPVLLPLDQPAPGPYLNEGTAGGQLDMGTPSPVSGTL